MGIQREPERASPTCFRGRLKLHQLAYAVLRSIAVYTYYQSACQHIRAYLVHQKSSSLASHQPLGTSTTPHPNASVRVNTPSKPSELSTSSATSEARSKIQFTLRAYRHNAILVYCVFLRRPGTELIAQSHFVKKTASADAS